MMGGSAFDIIEIIQDYENFHFGETTRDFSDPEGLINMFAYIVGEYWLNKSKTLRDNWNNILSEEDLEDIIDELENVVYKFGDENNLV